MREERCSNCFFNKHDNELSRFYCCNVESDRYEDTTEYSDSCEYWRDKGKSKGGRNGKQD